jgi:hypothetical protein
MFEWLNLSCRICPHAYIDGISDIDTTHRNQPNRTTCRQEIAWEKIHASVELLRCPRAPSSANRRPFVG